jgi:uncharacterized RDD family membrane protein YckC
MSKTSRRPSTPPKPIATVVAGPGPRVRAFLADLLLVGLYLALLAGATLFVPGVGAWMAARFGPDQSPGTWDGWAFLTVILPVLLYFALTEASARRGSWGRRRAGLLVIGPDGGRLNFGRSLLRNALKFLPWQLGHTALFQTMAAEFTLAPHHYLLYGLSYGTLALYLAFLFFHPQHRTPYDRVSGAQVVERR